MKQETKGKHRHLFLTTAKALIAAQNLFLSLSCKLLFGNNDRATEPRRILLLRTAALGDFLFALPAMAALRRRFPSAKIIFLTTSATDQDTRNALQGYVDHSAFLPWLRFAVPSIIDDAICFNSLTPKVQMKEIRPRIQSFAPEIAFILSHPGEGMGGLFKKILFLKLMGMNKPVYGWRMQASNRFLRDYQFRAGLFEHHIMGPLRSVAHFSSMPPLERMQIDFPLFIADASEKWSDQVWRGKNWNGKKIIALAPGSIQPHKRWPVENFIALCRQLAALYNPVFVVIGTKNDRETGHRICENATTEALNLAGRISIMHAAALLKRCTLLIGNDGGAMHLGAAVGCPGVSIVPGIEFPRSVEPWGFEKFAVRHPVPCAPCYSFTRCPKGHNRCMVDLPVQDVVEKSIQVLEKIRFLENSCTIRCRS